MPVIFKPRIAKRWPMKMKLNKIVVKCQDIVNTIMCQDIVDKVL